ncbi:hypothetical protein XO10_01710 [Marinitoga sp. 1135]|uniref:Uncharacterized protein n=1 Tax=Marinitoga piezophila (strain DSM 14283 / JCM 11233 / KA3) TaxID=443254 RepID=H2J3Z5_MARPK|nr:MULTISPECIES: hypothetical protein [Marinitoga]AEX84723.1 hypothetical protein Marpi_0271 [Marinitoga piezophila KA3]NUU95025.1 hypothetical protein [Marinitoga sp. 1135]
MHLKKERYFLGIGIILMFINELNTIGIILQFIGIYLLSEKTNNKKTFYYFVISLFLFYSLISFFVPQSIIMIFKNYPGLANNFDSLFTLRYSLLESIRNYFFVISLSFFIYLISLILERIAYKNLYDITLSKELSIAIKLISVEAVVLTFSYLLLAKFVIDDVIILNLLIILFVLNLTLIFLIKLFEIIGFINIEQ